MSLADDWRSIWLLDFEASDIGGFPVEVAAGNVVSGEVRAWLIGEHPDWSWQQWSRRAQGLHGLTRGLLRERGRPAREVAAELAELVGGGGVLATSPAYDGRWLHMLCEAGGTTIRQPYGWDELLRGRFHESRVIAAANCVDEMWRVHGRREHRAGADVALGLCVASRLLEIDPPMEALLEHAPRRVLPDGLEAEIAAGRADGARLWREAVGLTIAEVAQLGEADLDEVERIDRGEGPIDESWWRYAFALGIRPHRLHAALR